MNQRLRITTITVLSTLSSLILLAAGLAKSINYSNFYDSLSQWHILRTGTIATLAAMVPFIEIILSLLWLLNVKRTVLNYLISGMLIAYTIAIVTEHKVSGNVECHCFSFIQSGSESKELVWYIARNTALCLPFILLGFFSYKDEHQ